MSPSRSAPRRREAPEVRRLQILEAAMRCFSERGYHESTMDDVVRASGLSKGSLYWHFRSKEEIFLAIFDLFEADLARAWEQSDGRLVLLDRLREVGASLIHRIVSERWILRTTAEFLSHPEARQRYAVVYQRTRARLELWLGEAIGRGEVRRLSPESLAALFTAAVEGLLLQALVDPEFDPEIHWPVFSEVLGRGIQC